MPTIRCSGCGTLVEVLLREYKLLDPKSVHLCSTTCLLEAIRSHSKPEAPWPMVLEEWDMGPGATWSDELGAMFRSRYEVVVAKFLSKNDIEYEYERYWFPLIKTVYIPDFYLPEYGVFLEVKGQYGVGAKNKLGQFRTMFPQFPLYTISWPMRHIFDDDK